MVVQWLYFAGFYQKKIIKEFEQSATNHSITGFLAHGKPAVACLEGNQTDVKEFLRFVRTTVFATVPRSARKMTLGLLEISDPSPNNSNVVRRKSTQSDTSLPRFDSFQAKAFYAQGTHHRPDMLDRRQLEAYLRDHGVPDKVCADVLSVPEG